MSDESLELERFTRPKRERDVEFAEFMAVSMGPLHRSAFLLCGDADRADELTQHALERTYRAWPRAREGDPLSYARRVLVNLRIDGWRRTRREVLTDPHALREHEAASTIPTIPIGRRCSGPCSCCRSNSGASSSCDTCWT